MSDFWLISTAILLEGLPFAFLGGVLAATIELLLPQGFPDWVRRPRPRPLQIAIGIAAAFCLPICECSNVPFVKRLLAKGMPPGIALAFLFSAPIVNPICMASTAVAFRASAPWLFLGLRLAGGLFVVVLMTLWLLRQEKSGAVFVDWKSSSQQEHRGSCSCCHSHQEVDAESPPIQWQRLAMRWIHAATHDFLEVATYLLVAACCLAGLQVLVDRAVFSAPLDHPGWGPVASVGMAYLFCLCSSVDAFVIAAFPGMSAASKLAFLTAGPLFDLKLVWIYQSLFQKKAVLQIGVCVTLVVLLVSWFWDWGWL